MTAFDYGFRVGLLLSMKQGRGTIDQDAFVGVKENLITCVQSYTDTLRDQSQRFVDASHQAMIPGLINGHTHLAMSLFRGYEDDCPLQEWLFKRIFPIEATLVDERFVRVGTQLSALECIRFGTTTVNDQYFFPYVTAGVLDRAGMRGWVAQPFIDFIIPDEKHLGDQALQSRASRYVKFKEQYALHPRIRSAIAPHSPYTCSDQLMKEVCRLAKSTQSPLHMHISETKVEVDDSFKNYKKSPIQRMKDLGLFESPTMIAHGVHFSDEDIRIVQDAKASVIYNPDSNAKLGAGIARIPDYRKQGIPVGIGTDGAASNNDLSIFGAMNIGTKLQKLSHGDSTAMIALDAINLATYEGAKALGLDNQIGSIEVGKRADLVLLNLDEPHTQPMNSLLSQLVYSFNGLEVDTVMCDGALLMEAKQFKTLSKSDIYLEAAEIKKGFSVSHGSNNGLV